MRKAHNWQLVNKSASLYKCPYCECGKSTINGVVNYLPKYGGRTDVLPKCVNRNVDENGVLWMDIIGYEDLYSKDTNGRVKSHERISKRIGKQGNVIRFRTPEKILNPTFRFDRGLTAYYTLHKDGTRYQYHTVMNIRHVWNK